MCLDTPNPPGFNIQFCSGVEKLMLFKNSQCSWKEFMYLGNELESDFSHVTLLNYGHLGLITVRTRVQFFISHLC